MIDNLKNYYINSYKIFDNNNNNNEYKQEELAEIINKIDKKFRNICSIPLYNSTLLTRICTRVEVIATALLCIQNQCPPQRASFACFQCHHLSYNIYVLKCFHRFCYTCRHSLIMKNDHHDCPICSRHSV